MKLLVVTLDGAGNWPPERSLIGELVQQGHNLTVVSDNAHRQDVERVGATFSPYRYAAGRDDLAEMTLDYVISQIVLNPAHRDDLLAAVAEVEPDLLLVDMMMWSAIAAAESLQIPTVILWHSIYGYKPTLADLHPKAKQVLDDERTKLGLPEVGSPREQAERSDAIIAFTLASFDEPPTPHPANLHYVGPLACLPGKVEGPAYELPFEKGDDRPLVLVSFSTSFMDQLDALQRVATALGQIEVRGLLTVGPAMDASQLHLPENVRAETFVPHSQVLPQTRLVVTHCGHGTTMAAVTAGVPMLCMPMGRDQFDVRDRVIANGLGESISQKAAPNEIRDAIERLLASNDMPARCQAFAEMVDLPSGMKLAISLLEAFGQQKTRHG